MSKFGESLLSDIQKSYTKRLANDRKLRAVANRVRDGTDYVIANDYAIRSGELLSEAIRENTKSLAYMSDDLAREVLPPLLQADHDLITQVTDTIQQNMNIADGVMLGVQTPALDTNRIDGIIEKVASYQNYADGRWVLGEPIVNYSQAIVNQAIRDNAKVSAKAGVKTEIVRKAEASGVVKSGKRKYKVPCKWCKALEGTYEYTGYGQNIPREVFQQHEACRCTLTFKRGKFRQDVWRRERTWTEEDTETQKALTKAEEKRLKKKEEQEEKDRLTLQLKNIGFQNIDEKVFKYADRDLLKANLTRLEKLEEKYNVIKRSRNTWFAYDSRTSSVAYVRTYTHDYSTQEMFITRYFKNGESLANDMRRWVNSNWMMPIDVNNSYEVATSTLTHEYGHMIHNLLYQQALNSGYIGTREDYVSDIVRNVYGILGKNDEYAVPWELLSDYGKTNCFEAFAEIFANSQGSKPNGLGLAMREWLESSGL